jgi:HSP20 family protein
MNYFTVRNPIRTLERELDNWLGGIPDPFAFDASCARGFAPSVDISEEDDGYLVRAELPGMGKSDVEITLKDEVLTLKGEKKTAAEEKKEGRYYRRESWAGSFERRIVLPDTADPEGVSAEMKDGVLTVKIAKRPETKPRNIEING